MVGGRRRRLPKLLCPLLRSASLSGRSCGTTEVAVITKGKPFHLLDTGSPDTDLMGTYASSRI